ncbi:hypothetical protein CVT24_001503 [Panaeolus cyanescens]|uniref:Uncharacterized protein n=1 Tax=Panaeolus cyanescens TaxID=181874 RepID=A0A409YFB3_9AGAR|nr:hypothetical protein CVT24_001503 [Panaeolus cyanescens]
MGAFDLISKERFRPYLSNDGVPGEDILSEILSDLENLEKQREGTIRCIDVLNLTLSALQKQRRRLDHEISSYKSVLSPIRRLPDDMLSEIFLHTLPSTRHPLPVLTEPPLLLTTVCKKWKRIAEATPRLWSKLHIVCPSGPNSATVDEDFKLLVYQYTTGVKRWLELSHDTPLALFLSLDAPYGGSMYYPDHHFHPLAEELLHFIIQQSPRWSTLELSCTVPTLRLMYRLISASGMHPTLPALRRLRFHIEYGEGGESQVEDRKGLFPFSNSSITELSLNLWGHPLFKFLSSIYNVTNWGTLTHLTIHNFAGYLQPLLGTFRKCPQLEALLLSCYGNTRLETESGEFTWVTPSELISMPKLTTFTLQYGNDDEYNFCAFFDTPALTQFSFYPTYYKEFLNVNEASNISSPLRRFLARCSNLRSLTLDPRWLTSKQDMVSIIQTVPQIEHITFNHASRPMWMHNFEKGTYPIISEYDDQRYTRHLNWLFGVQLTDSDRPLPASNSSVQQLLPNIQAISFLEIFICPKVADAIMEVCKSRISRTISEHGIRDDNIASNSVSPASLNYIQITGAKFDSTVAIEDELARYAESIGRRVGEDLVLDITYPWGPITQVSEDTTDRLSIFDHQRGLSFATDRTWGFIEA